jgi:hypothetical protein
MFRIRLTGVSVLGRLHGSSEEWRTQERCRLPVRR